MPRTQPSTSQTQPSIPPTQPSMPRTEPSMSRIEPSMPSCSPTTFGSNSSEDLSSSQQAESEGLRLVVIDGSNVAMDHGRGNFSVRGLVLAMEHFREKGHQVVIFLPRKRYTRATQEDQAILNDLYQTGILSWVQNGAYDDMFIIRHADQTKGIILSNDRYRDVLRKHPELKDQIKRRTLRFTWVGDTLMIAEDPFGPYGPSLNELLHF